MKRTIEIQEMKANPEKYARKKNKKSSYTGEQSNENNS